MKELVLDAVPDRLDEVLRFVDEQLEDAGCPMKTQMQIDLAVEEIFVNVANYAYAPEIGPVTVRSDLKPDGSALELTFIDRGVPYNPLEKKDPDITLTAEQREIGGLGIFLAKKNMDDMQYQYADGCNILTVRKQLPR